MYHIHHIIPRHAGGTDDPDNLIKLTIEEHAQAHLDLFNEYGRWQDEIAWLSLTKQIDNAEATRRAQIMGNKGPRTGRRLEATLENGKKGNEAWKGKTHTEEAKKVQSEKNKKYWGKIKERPWQYKSRFIVDGIEYIGFKYIIEKYGISRQTVYNRCNSSKYPDWEKLN